MTELTPEMEQRLAGFTGFYSQNAYNLPDYVDHLLQQGVSRSLVIKPIWNWLNSNVMYHFVSDDYVLNILRKFPELSQLINPTNNENSLTNMFMNMCTHGSDRSEVLKYMINHPKVNVKLCLQSAYRNDRDNIVKMIKSKHPELSPEETDDLVYIGTSPGDTGPCNYAFQPPDYQNIYSTYNPGILSAH